MWKVLVYLGVLVAIVAAYGSCGMMISTDSSVNLLQATGFEDVKLVDRSIFFVVLRGCAKDDFVMFEFSAKNPKGKSVNIRTCEGIWKGATLRGD